MAEELQSPQKYEPARQSRLTSASLFKIVVPILVVGFILYLIYTFLSGLRSAQRAVKSQVSPTPTTITTTQEISPLATNQTGIRSVKAGMQSDAFYRYGLNLSEGWESEQKSDASVPSDIVTLTKDTYSMSIVQEKNEGDFCLFPDDDAGAAGQRYTSYVSIPGINAQFRRATVDSTTYVVCEKKGNQYVYPTSFGHITYTVPVPSDPKIISEMDAMVASLNK